MLNLRLPVTRVVASLKQIQLLPQTQKPSHSLTEVQPKKQGMARPPQSLPTFEDVGTKREAILGKTLNPLLTQAFVDHPSPDSQALAATVSVRTHTATDEGK